MGRVSQHTIATCVWLGAWLGTAGRGLADSGMGLLQDPVTRNIASEFSEER